jgi:hypothetical protein
VSTLAEQAQTQGRAWQAHRRGCGPCGVGGPWCPEGSLIIGELERLVNAALGNAVMAAINTASKVNKSE